jgi:hypothetical protein
MAQGKRLKINVQPAAEEEKFKSVKKFMSKFQPELMMDSNFGWLVRVKLEQMAVRLEIFT